MNENARDTTNDNGAQPDEDSGALKPLSPRTNVFRCNGKPKQSYDRSFYD